MDQKRSSISRTNRKLIYLADALLILGLLSYSAIRLILDKTRSPSVVANQPVWIEQRFFWLNIAEKILAICKTLYLWASIWLICRLAKENMEFSFKMLAVYFIAQAMLMIFCTVPFGLLDYTYFENYIFPLPNLFFAVLELMLLSAATLLRKRKPKC